MASNISTYSINIDEAFPVAGVDNESQGFRDNFDLIKTALTVADSEITDLQDTTAKVNAANNFSGNTIVNTDLNMVALTEKAIVKGEYDTGSTPEIQYREGSYQVSSIIDDKTYLISWKTASAVSLGNNRLAKMTLQVSCSDVVTHTLDFSVEGGGDIFYDNNDSVPYVIGENPTIIDLWTYDGGTTMYVKKRGTFETL